MACGRADSRWKPASPDWCIAARHRSAAIADIFLLTPHALEKFVFAFDLRERSSRVHRIATADDRRRWRCLDLEAGHAELRLCIPGSAKHAEREEVPTSEMRLARQFGPVLARRYAPYCRG